MSIPTSLIVVLLVVAWLVVLVPMIARRRERVPQAQPAGSGFRVLRRASASLRRRPGRGAKGPTVTASDMIGDAVPDASNETLVSVGAVPENQPADAAEEWAAARSTRRGRAAAQSAEPLGDPVDDEHGVGDEHGADRSGEATRDATADQLPTVRFAPDAADDETAAAETIPDEVNEQEWADHVAAAPVGASFDEVEAEQLRPVPHRPGRGGFDPEAAEATRSYRYQQRRRVTLILLVATVVFIVAALLLANWLWVGVGLSVALLVGYLAYLRRQVRIESAIRQRRMERLQRARQIRPEYARASRGTRAGTSAVAPGRAVVDLDDNDPGFDDLKEFRQSPAYRRAAGQ